MYLDKLPQKFNDKIFQKLKNIVDVKRLTTEERLAYDLSLNNYRDFINCVNEGESKGKIEGLAEGKIIGKAERSLEIAAALKKEE